MPQRRVVVRRNRLITVGAVVTDLAAITIGYVTARWLRVENVDDLVPTTATARTVFLTIPLWLAIFAAHDLYDRRRLAAPSEEARRVFHAVSVSVAAVVLFTFVLDMDVARSWIALLWVTSLVSVAATRFAMRRAVHRLNAHHVVGTRTIIVGTNFEARAIARSLDRQRWHGYEPAGFVATKSPAAREVEGKPVLGTHHDLKETVTATDAGAVIVAGTAVGPDELLDVHRSLENTDVELRVSPALPHVAASRMNVQPLDGLALITLDRTQFTRRQAILKRAFDLVAASALLVVSFPVMVATALAIFVTSGRPVLFRQTRVGQDGRPFTIYKFRTMERDAETQLETIIDLNEADGVLFKVRQDPRVTRIGGVLRTLALDELPQLFNVLKGDMSVVGPRPALPREMEAWSDAVRGRLRVKPGLTGMWQVNGRHELPFDDYVRYDLFYTENWSLGLDLYIVLKTVPAVLSRRGAY